MKVGFLGESGDFHPCCSIRAISVNIRGNPRQKTGARWDDDL